MRISDITINNFRIYRGENHIKFDNKTGNDDKVFVDNKIKIIVDKKSLLYLAGTTLEYSGGLNGKGFIFVNPNANRTCGCGESFSL